MLTEPRENLAEEGERARRALDQVRTRLVFTAGLMSGIVLALIAASIEIMSVR